MIFVLGLSFKLTAHSQEFVWAGTVDSNWSNALNWSPGVPSSGNGTALLFDAPGPVTLVNNLPGGLTLNSLTIGAASGAREFQGNALTFSGTTPTLRMLNPVGDAFFTQNMVLNSGLTATGGPSLTGQLLIAGTVSGAGDIRFDSGFSLIYGTNTFNGATTVGTGALLGVAGGGLAATSGVTVETGGELRILRPSPTSGTTVNRSLNLSGVLSTTSRVRSFFGSPVGTATWSGAVTLGGAASMVASGGDAGEFDAVELRVSGPVNLNGHELTLRTAGVNNSVVVTGAVSGNANVRVRDTVDAGVVSLASLAGNGRLDVAMASSLGSVTVTGNMTGNRDILLNGGTLTLNGTGNTFTGSVVSAGTAGVTSILTVANDSRLGNAANAVTLRDGGALRFTSSGTVARAFQIENGGTLLRPSGSSSFTGNITGTGGLSISGGITDLSGNNSFTGGLRVAGGTVNYVSDASFGAAGQKIVLDGGQINVAPSLSSFSRPLEILGMSASGPIGFFITGNALPFAFSSAVSGPGRFELRGQTGQEIAVAGDVTGAGERRFLGRSIFTLTGENPFSGRLTVLGQSSQPTTLIAASATHLGGATSPMTLGANATTPVILRATGNLDFAATRPTNFFNLTVDTNGNNVTFNQAMSGSGLTKNGAGVLTFGGLTDSLGASHPIRINEGTLRLGADNALGSRANVILLSSTTVFDLAGHAYSGSVNAEFSGSRILLGAGTLALNGGYIAADISGLGGLVVTGGSSLGSPEAQLVGNNTFLGGVRVEQFATLTIGVGNPLITPGISLVLDNGVLRVIGEAPQPVVIGPDAPLTIGAGGATFDSRPGALGQSMVIERQLTGSAPLKFTGGSRFDSATKYEVRLAHANNTFTGPIALGNGEGRRDDIIGIVADASLGNPANTVTLGDLFDSGEGFKTALGGLRAYANLTLPTTRAIRLLGDDDGSSFVGESGGGVIDTNGFAVVIEGGISQLNSNAAPLIKTGAGTLSLNGNNTYTGTTSVALGTLLINGNSSAAVGAVEVSSGVLGGSGTLGGTVTLAAGGSLSPGAAVGTLTIQGGLHISAMAAGGSGKLNFQLGSITASDKVVVSGALTIGTQALAFSDFNFTTLAGLQNGTYKLITNASNIVGSLDPLPANLSGTLGAGPAQGALQFTGNDLELVVTGVGAAPVAQFAISAIASPQTVGTAITGITITAQNSSNATATSFNGTVTFGGTGGFSGTSATFTAGVLSGVSITPNVAGSNLTFTVTDSGSNTGSTTIATIRTRYEAWAGTALFNDDANSDGVKNGLAWLLGATSPVASVNLPVVSHTTNGLILSFSMLNAANRGPVTLQVEHSSDLGIADAWTAASIPETTNAIPSNGITFVITPAGNLNIVEARISNNESSSGRLFGRLKVE